MARVREFDIDKVSAEILHLFWRKGYSETSLKDMMDKTNLEKSSLYNTFGNKEKIFLHAFELYIKEVSSRINLEGENGISKIRDFFEQMLPQKHKNSPSGCLILSSVNEFQNLDNSDPKKKLAQKGWDCIEKFLIESMRSAQEEEIIKPSIDISSEVRWLISQIFALRSLEKLEKVNYCDEVLKKINLHLESLLA